MSKWFAQKNNKITGPFDQIQIENLISTNPNDILIWGKGMSEWLAPNDWKDFLNQKNSVLETAKAEPMWFFKYNDKESAALNFNELTSELKKITNYDGLYLKNDTQPNKWQSIFALPIIADELGITRRNTPRVPILGFLNGQRLDDHTAIKAKVVTISEGGCGVTDGSGINAGTSLKGIIKSPNLNGDIHIHADVVYVGKDGYIGMQFSSISPESKSQIIEYVNKFKES